MDSQEGLACPVSIHAVVVFAFYRWSKLISRTITHFSFFFSQTVTNLAVAESDSCPWLSFEKNRCTPISTAPKSFKGYTSRLPATNWRLEKLDGSARCLWKLSILAAYSVKPCRSW